MSKIAVHRALVNRRFSLTVAGLLALAGLAAGCGGGDSTTTTTVAPGQSTQDTIREFGLEATSSQAKPIEATVSGYMDARVAGEWEKACTYLTKSVRQLFDQLEKKAKEAKESGKKGGRLGSKGCTGFVEEATRKLTPSKRAGLAKIRVTSVRVKEDQSYTLYRETSGDEAYMSLSREGGGWKLSSIEGTPFR